MPRKLPIYPLFLLLMLLLGCKKEPPTAPQLILPPDEEAMTELTSIIGPLSPYADSLFSADVKRLLPPLDSVELELGRALDPESGVTLYGVIIPYRQSVITAPGGHIYIGLNHYLGQDYPGYKGAFPSYLRHRKTIERLPIEVMQARMASLFPAEFGASPTLLNRMLYEGALLESANERMQAPDSTLLGFTAEELQWCMENEANLWKTILSRDMLYSTDSQLSERLLLPAANSNLLSGNAPGQAALFLAVKIVRAYCKKTGDSPRTILENKLYNDNQTLIKSEYAPV